MLIFSVCLGFAHFSYAECPDFDAKLASDDIAQSYLNGKTFQRALVLKKHLPSMRKEVASYVYVKSSDLYYTVYTLVNSDCEAQVIKRTNGKH